MPKPTDNMPKAGSHKRSLSPTLELEVRRFIVERAIIGEPIRVINERIKEKWQDDVQLSDDTISRWRREEQQEAIERINESADELVEMMQANLAKMQAAVQPAAEAGDLPSIKAALDIQTRWSKLRGLDGPVKYEGANAPPPLIIHGDTDFTGWRSSEDEGEPEPEEASTEAEDNV